MKNVIINTKCYNTTNNTITLKIIFNGTIINGEHVITFELSNSSLTINGQKTSGFTFRIYPNPILNLKINKPQNTTKIRIPIVVSNIIIYTNNCSTKLITT